MKLPSKKTLLLLCALAFLLNAFALATLASPWNATTGVTWQSDGTTSGVVASDVREPALRVGIRNGDRSDLRTLGAANGYANPVVGVPYHVPLWRNGHRVDATVLPIQLPLWWPRVVRAVAVVWLLGFAVLIVLRAAPTTENRFLALILICFALESPQSRFVIPSQIGMWLLGYALPIFSICFVLLALYANQYGTPLSGPRRLVFRFTIACSALAVILYADYFFPLINPPISVAAMYIFAQVLPLTCPLVALLLAIAAAPAQEKQRITWVFAGFFLFDIGLAIAAFQPGERGSTQIFQETAYAAIPLALTYAALARRMFDVGFILNRAAVFAVVSAIVVGAFVVLEWSLAKWFEDVSHATSLALNAALALGIGFSMRFVHKYVDRFIDAVFFRKRHENETALRRFGREAAFITDRETLLDRARCEILERTDASSVKILAPEELPANDPALLALRAWHEPLDLGTYQTAIEGDLAFPMSAHGKFAGAIVCGEKRNGEHYAPDEIDAISVLANGVGLALSDFDRQSHDGPAIASALATITSTLATITSRLDELSTDGALKAS